MKHTVPTAPVRTIPVQAADSRPRRQFVTGTLNPTPQTDDTTAVPATLQAAPDAPCDAHPWCVETGTHIDHMSRRVSLPATDGLPPILTAHLYTDQAAGLPELNFDPGHDDWREGLTGDQMRAEVARVRAHLVRLDAFADEYDALCEAGGEQPPAAGSSSVTTAVVAIGRGPDAGTDDVDVWPVSGMATYSFEAAYNPARISLADAEARVRALLATSGVRVDRFLNEDADGPVAERPTAQLVDAAEAVKTPLLYEFQTASLNADTPLVLRYVKSTGRVHVGWDPRHITHFTATALFHLCADSAGVDATGVAFPTVRQLAAAEELTRIVAESSDPPAMARRALALFEAERKQAADVPSPGQYTDWDNAESIKTAGATGAILKVYLHTPREINGEPTGPQRLAVYSEDGTDDELDLAGALDLREQMAALLPNLDAMIAILAADEADRQSGGAR